MGIMKSLYSGKCTTCAKPIAAGDHIDYRGKNNVHHLSCVQMFPPFIERDEHEANALADTLRFFEKGKTVPHQQPTNRNRR